MSRFPGQTELMQAKSLLNAQQYDQAEDLCKKVLKKHKPAVPDACRLLATIAMTKGDNDDAVRYCQRGLKAKPGEPIFQCMIGQIRLEEGRLDDAEKQFRTALRLHPEFPGVRAKLADTFQHMGAYDKVESLLGDAISAGTEQPDEALIWAIREQHEDRHAEAVELLERHRTGATLSMETRWRMNLALGRSYERLNDYDKAFEAYRRGNEVVQQPFNPDAMRAMVDDVIAAFSRKHMETLPQSSNDSELPVFVASMPRAGSTLTEQILASHPHVHGSGENLELIKLMRGLPGELRSEQPFPHYLDALDERRLDRLASRYLSRMQKLDRTAARVTNKQLGVYRYIGLAARMFPKMQVVYCRRDPMDCCFSCFMLPLSPTAAPWSTDLKNIAEYFLQYERLMRHWRDVLEIPIHTVFYEDIVADQERVTRGMIDHLGLEWDDACLRFWETKRFVNTPSFGQVRQKLYTHAVRRYEHYEKHLAPLREVLAGYIKD